MHKKYVGTVSIVITVYFVAITNSIASAADQASLLFLGNKNIAPVVYLDNDVPTGVAVDIVRALAQHMLKPVDIKAMDWVEAQVLVARGEADALIQINQTEERKQLYDFSDPLLESQFSIFTGTNRVGISGISSLRGLRVGVESGGLPRQLLEKNPRILLTIIPNFLEGFRQLNHGTIDAVVVDYRVGSYIIAENKLRNIKVAGEPIAYSYSAIAVKKGNAALLAAINHGLNSIKADGTYGKIIDAWEPKEVLFKTREQIAQMTYSAVVIILLVLFMIAALWTATLKRELVRRKAAEAKLKDEEARYRALFEDSPISLWEEDFSSVKQYLDELSASGVLDFRSHFEAHPEEIVRCARSTKIIAVNQATLRLFKAKSKEDLLAGLESIFCEESFTIFTDELITLAGGGTQFQSEAVQKDLLGEQFNTVVRLSVAPGYEKSWERVFVSVSDITDRKRIEDDLRKSEENYRRLLDTVQEGIWVIDTEAVTIFVNPRMAEILGYTAEEMIGKHLFAFMDEQGRMLAESNIERRKLGIKEQHDFEFIRKDGSRIYTSLETGPIFDDAGEYAGSIAAVADISERKKAEEDIRRLNEELELRVKQRTAELEAMNSELEKMNRVFIGRELRMIELKERIRDMEQARSGESGERIDR